MGSSKEIEIKFRVKKLPALTRDLRKAEFYVETTRTHEMNTLYDLPDRPLQERGELLRLRKFGTEWVLTDEATGTGGRRKTRKETETGIADGKKLDAIPPALGYEPTFRHQKFRTEWSARKRHVVADGR